MNLISDVNKIISTTFILIFGIVIKSNAQRLPDLQKESLRAPVDIKIDGKPSEWNNTFKAFNKSTEVFYTISNDDNKLYLTIKADRRNIINKILNGGIAVTIKKGNKKDRSTGVSLTYPVFKGNERPSIDFKDVDEATSTTAAKKANSAMILSNLSINSFARFMRTNGIAGVDTLISADDNHAGINANAAVDDKLALNVEFAIDLKLIGLSAEQNKFSYNVQLVAVDQSGIPEIEVIDGTEGLRKGETEIQQPKKADQYSSSKFNTDFWGEYVLAK